MILRPLSLSYQKDGLLPANPSFGITSTESVSHQNPPILPLVWHRLRRLGLPAHPSFGMTTTQDIRDLFAYRGPLNFTFKSRRADTIISSSILDAHAGSRGSLDTLSLVLTWRWQALVHVNLTPSTRVPRVTSTTKFLQTQNMKECEPEYPA